jgi:hypothetical protein
VSYREATVGKTYELTMPYMPSEASERALYASSMALPFGGALTLGMVVNPIVGVVGMGIAALGGVVLVRSRRSPVRFVLDDVALEVVWPRGAAHGSALRLSREQRWDASFGAGAPGSFTIYLVGDGTRYVEVNDAPTPTIAMAQCDRLRAFLARAAR